MFIISVVLQSFESINIGLSVTVQHLTDTLAIRSGKLHSMNLELSNKQVHIDMLIIVI